MEKLKLYFSDGTSLTIPENLTVKYIINSAITSITQNMSISILHKLINLELVLKDIYVSNIKNKIIIKVERYNENQLIDSMEGESLIASWNLGGDIVANEEVYNEVISIEG